MTNNIDPEVVKFFTQLFDTLKEAPAVFSKALQSNPQTAEAFKQIQEQMQQFFNSKSSE